MQDNKATEKSRVYLMYFNGAPVPYVKYYLVNNMSLTGRKIHDMRIMSDTGSDSVGLPLIIQENGVNYVNLALSTVSSCFITIVDKKGVVLHEDLPFNQMTTNNNRNYDICMENIDFDKSFIYWSEPLAATFSVIPFLIKFD
jgi:hypothetical protein